MALRHVSKISGRNVKKTMAGTPVEKKPIKDLLAEKDAFLTTSERIYEYFLRHTRAFIIAAAAVALLAAAWAAYSRYEESAELTASAAYEDALEAMSQSPEKATVALETVRTDFKGRKAARLAAYTLVSLYSAQNENAKALALAEELMRALPLSEAAMKPVLLSDLAGLYEAEKKYDEAAATYESILELGVAQPQLRRDGLMALGRVNTARGRTIDAANNYQAVINEFPNDMKAYMANSFLASIEGAPRAFPGSLPAGGADAAAPANN